jgi:integrase
MHWWSGVLLMFTGMRAGELAQLLASDFVFDAPIPHVKVQLLDDEGAKTKSAKNQASIRDIPLAPVLLTLGLREFVAAQAKAHPKKRVFFAFRLGTNSRKSEGVTRFWGDFLKANGLWKEGRASHVWRHTVIQCLRANGAAQEDIAALVGHSPGSITGAYGGAYPLNRKLETAKLLDYGFDVAAALGGPFKQYEHG